MSIKYIAVAALAAASALLLPRDDAKAAKFDIVIDETDLVLSDRTLSAMGMNGSIPGPILRLKEGEDLEITVTNKLDEDSSIHWHGLILPASQDGVPGISFPGIPPGESFTYRFPAQLDSTTRIRNDD